jgi:hypothetical protein
VPRPGTVSLFLFAFAGLGALSTTRALADGPSQPLEPHADTRNVDPNVFVRKRPEYDPPGIRVGAFIFYPSVRTAITYTDNVFNDASSKVDDFIWEVEPRLVIQSDWNRHSLSFSGVARHYNYFEQTSENRTDVILKSDLRIDIARTTSVTLQGRYSDVHEERGTDDLLGGFDPGDPAEPTEREDLGATVALSQDFNWLHLGAGAGFDAIRYENTPVVGGGPAINNQDRNRDVTSAYVSAGYEFMPKLRVFGRLTWNEHDFERAVDDSGLNHDSRGWTVDAGLALLDSQVLTGEVYASYFRQDFDDPAFSASSGPGFGAKLAWFPTMLTTVKLEGSRRVEDTSVSGASSYVATTLELAACHELMRNVVLTGRIGAEQQKFQSLDRTDEVIFAGLGARYLLTENLELGAEWRFLSRDSDDDTVEFDTNRASLSVTGKF